MFLSGVVRMIRRVRSSILETGIYICGRVVFDVSRRPVNELWEVGKFDGYLGRYNRYCPFPFCFCFFK